jgi:hypothetical protein
VLAWKKRADETCGLRGEFVSRVCEWYARDVHFALRLVLFFFLLGFYFSSHLVLLSTTQWLANVWRRRKGGGAPYRIQSCIALALRRVSTLWFRLYRAEGSLPTILLVVANLRVFFATPMIAPEGCVLGASCSESAELVYGTI